MGLEALSPSRVRFGSGLRAIVTPMPNVHRAVVTAYLRIGSRFESGAQNGISHFLEHMLFRGTRRHPSAHRLAVGSAARSRATSRRWKRSRSPRFWPITPPTTWRSPA
jgi:predicted Zn-dependent peptidase